MWRLLICFYYYHRCIKLLCSLTPESDKKFGTIADVANSGRRGPACAGAGRHPKAAEGCRRLPAAGDG
jgi:hypothetical protein